VSTYDLLFYTSSAQYTGVPVLFGFVWGYRRPA
jgi:hypothetical protein